VCYGNTVKMAVPEIINVSGEPDPSADSIDGTTRGGFTNHSRH